MLTRRGRTVRFSPRDPTFALIDAFRVQPTFVFHLSLKFVEGFVLLVLMTGNPLTFSNINEMQRRKRRTESFDTRINTRVDITSNNPTTILCKRCRSPSFCPSSSSLLVSRSRTVSRTSTSRDVPSPSFTTSGQMSDLYQLATMQGTLGKLTGALSSLGLANVLKSNGTFTIFAPADLAFSKLSASKLTSLLTAGKKDEALRILKYHVLVGQKLTSNQINQMNLPTNLAMLDGGTVRVSKRGNSIQINDATVTQADISAPNGILHIIDTVLLPSSSVRGHRSSLFLPSLLLCFLFLGSSLLE